MILQCGVTQVRLLLLAALSGEHILFIGPPGTAKSELGRRLSRLYSGRYFERLLTRFSVPEARTLPLTSPDLAFALSLILSSCCGLVRQSGKEHVTVVCTSQLTGKQQQAHTATETQFVSSFSFLLFVSTRSFISSPPVNSQFIAFRLNDSHDSLIEIWESTCTQPVRYDLIQRLLRFNDPYEGTKLVGEWGIYLIFVCLWQSSYIASIVTPCVAGAVWAAVDAGSGRGQVCASDRRLLARRGRGFCGRDFQGPTPPSSTLCSPSSTSASSTTGAHPPPPLACLRFGCEHMRGA